MTVGSPGHICAFAGVNNKGRPSQPSPPSHRARACDGCDDGDGQCLLLWSARAHMPQAKRVLPGHHAMRGATARRFDSVRVRTEVCRVCGLHPGDAGRQTECRASVGISAQWMSATGANLSASPVRRYAPALGHLSDGRRVEVEFTPLGRKTVTPFTTSIGAGFRGYRGRKSAKRPPWNGAEERGIA